MIYRYTKKEIEELYRANELAEAVKVWHRMLKTGDLNSDMFIKLVGKKIEEIEREVRTDEN